MIDKDRVEGSLEQAKGKVKEVAGKVTGDSKTEAEGQADQVKGKVKNTIGGIKDTLKGESPSDAVTILTEPPTRLFFIPGSP